MREVIIILLLAVLIPFTVSKATADNDYTAGLSFYIKGDFRSSIEHLKAYIEKNPDPRAYYLIGYASYKLEDYSTAIKYFNEAYSIDPDFDPSTINLE